MLKITPIFAGTFKLDGGAMFGIVPRRLWVKLNPRPEKDKRRQETLRVIHAGKAPRLDRQSHR